DVKFIYAYFNVSENEYLQYMQKKLLRQDSISDEAELILADGTIHLHKGKIETMEGEFENSTGTIAFRALLPNPDKILKHGASGKVKIATAVKNALIVPQKSTFEIQDKTYVFVVGKNNEVKMQSFTPRTRLSHFYIIEDGLQAGDKIVYEGLQNVKDGMIIRTTSAPMDSLILLAQDSRMSEL
ncbi:MAG: efflux RND transporter periplasmic adaptor subunit, partial [Bacteroidota bacterium]